MPIDQTAMMGYPLMGFGSGFASGLVNRVMQRLLPTPLEKAQLRNIDENLTLARERLELEEARVRGEWNVRRELVLEQIAAEDKREDERDLRRRWPFELPAAAYVRYSQRFDGAAMNVVVRPIARATNARNEAETTLRSQLIVATDLLIDSIPRNFGRDIIYYRELETASRDPARARLEGQQLDAAMYSLTASEPSVLIQVSVDDARSIRARYACWGWAGDSGFPLSGALILKEANMSAADIEAGLLTIICALHSQFQAVSLLVKPALPHLVNVLGKSGTMRFCDDMHAGGGTSTADARAILLGSYGAALDTIAERAPIIAAESAATAAFAAHAGAKPELAEEFLTLALRYCAKASGFADEDMTVLIRSLVSASRQASNSMLRRALLTIRGLNPKDFAPEGRRLSLGNLSASYARQLRESARS